MADKAGKAPDDSILFTGQWDGTLLEKPFQDSMRKMQSGVVSTVGKLGSVTGKAQMLLAQFGGEMGGVAGKASYLASSVLGLVSKINPWELAVLGVTAAVGGLVWALGRESEEQQKWNDHVQKSITSADAMIKKIHEWTAAERVRTLGMSDEDKKIGEINEEIETQEVILGALMERYDEWKNALTAQEQLRIGKLVPGGDRDLARQLSTVQGKLLNLKLARDAYNKSVDESIEQAARDAEIEQDMATQMDAYNASIKKQAELEKEATDAARAHMQEKIKYAPDISKMMEEDQRSYDETIAARQRMMDTSAQLEREYYEGSELLAEENAEQKAARLQGQLDSEIELAEQREEILFNVTDIAMGLSDVFSEHEKTATAIKIAAIMLESGYEAAKETAAGFASLALIPPNITGAALHFTSAGMYAALAAGKIASSLRSGGGSSGSTQRERQRIADEMREDKSKEGKETTIIVNLGGREVGRAIMDELEKEQDRRSPGRPRRF